MLYAEIIRKKRNGGHLDEDEIAGFVKGITNGSATDAQIAALAMAVYFKGLDPVETVALTLAMRDSGKVLDWSGLDRPVADKHSTGGVGDNVSLMLAPMAAACGLAVPMISGRGLGHTGGTLDKMDAIPGYESQPDSDLFRKVVGEIGCAIIGQTADLAPADKRFYAIRDVTATVENLSLITASILSKKLAAGLGTLVLDVKYGTGAFMESVDDATDLANSLVRVANGAGTSTSALLTDMNEPLASAAGNAVEVVNAIEFLTGKCRDPRLEEVTIALTAQMLTGAGLADRPADAFQRASQSLDDGSAAEHFGKMVHALGGPSDIIENYYRHLPTAKVIRPVTAQRPGYVRAIDTRGVGVAVVGLGGGRRVAEDKVDHAVGLTGLACIGDQIAENEPLCMIHARDEASFEQAAQIIRAAYHMDDKAPEQKPAVLKQITADDVI